MFLLSTVRRREKAASLPVLVSFQRARFGPFALFLNKMSKRKLSQSASASSRPPPKKRAERGGASDFAAPLVEDERVNIPFFHLLMV